MHIPPFKLATGAKKENEIEKEMNINIFNIKMALLGCQWIMDFRFSLKLFLLCKSCEEAMNFIIQQLVFPGI